MFNDGLFASAVAETGVCCEEEILQWLAIRQKSYHYLVEKIALESLTGWRFNDEFGDLVHKSGKFFSIRGIEFQVSSDNVHCWQQPIIDQPEIGVLGFIAKKIDGVLHLLVQAKMEPGNVNMVQLSPTVQATRSNYTRVHGGKKPLYIDYFLDNQRHSVLYDQLQSEQGTRYFRKRNRNMIVEITEDFLFETTSDFTWMTIGQLQRLTRYDNLVHLDCRSILGGLSYGVADGELPVKFTGQGCGARVFDSMTCDLNTGEYSHAQVLSWLAGVKFSIEAKCKFISLRDVAEWLLDGGEIRHRDNKYFSVVGVSVEAESREVSNWTQPLVQSNDGGIIGLVCQMRGGILHVLVQALTEPGMIDIVELAPTVQCTPANYSDDIPAYVELVRDEGVGRNIAFDSMLSEEGGRFFHSEQRHLIVEVDADQNIPLKGNYCWMTLRQLQECGRYNNYLNIEMRSILCCISPLISG